MPSITHESLVDLFRDCPALATDILTDLGKLGPEESQKSQLTAAEFADIKADEYRADAVIRIGQIDADTDSGKSEPTDIVIVEVQLARDSKKRRSWPVYVTGARARYHCPATLLVLALDAGVANWCANSIILDRNGSCINPVVIGPLQIPRIATMERAREQPELAILSAVLHSKGSEAADAALAGLVACDGLDTDRATRYSDFILSMLGPAAWRALESRMSTQSYQFQSEFARKYAEQGRKEGREEGHKAGRKEGEDVGIEVGMELGMEAGERAMFLRLLSKRFGPLDAAVVAQVEQASVSNLELWADRILTAATLEEVLAD